MLSSGRHRLSRFDEMILHEETRALIEKYMTFRSWYRRWNQIRRFCLIIDIFERDIPRRGRLLDAGCGPGMYAIELSRSFDVDAVDISVDYLQRLQQWTAEIGGNIRASRHDLRSMPFGNNTFDVVLCSEVIEHMQDPSLAMAEIHRVLKKDGYLVFSMPNVLSIYWAGRRLLMLFGRDAKDENTRKHTRYTWLGIRRLLRSSGFVIKRTCGANYFEIPNERFVNRLCRTKGLLICLDRLENFLNRTWFRMFAANATFVCTKDAANVSF